MRSIPLVYLAVPISKEKYKNCLISQSADPRGRQPPAFWPDMANSLVSGPAWPNALLVIYSCNISGVLTLAVTPEQDKRLLLKKPESTKKAKYKINTQQHF